MTPEEMNFWKQILREGGAYTVLLVVLFFYRQDWKMLHACDRDLVETTKQQYDLTAGMLIKSTEAQTKVAAALAENTVVVHRVKSVLRAYLPQRRAEDPEEGDP